MLKTALTQNIPNEMWKVVVNNLITSINPNSPTEVKQIINSRVENT